MQERSKGNGETNDLVEKKGNVTSHRNRTRLGAFGNLSRLCFAAILAAMSLILGKFLQIPNPFQEFIRISFENLPILLAGLSMGPVVGALVGTVADLIGCALYGYSINPIITLGAAAVGAVSGTISHYVVRKPLVARVVVSATLAHTVGSVLIKSAGLAAWYLTKYQLGYFEFLAWRALNYAIICTAECLILCLLLRHRGFVKQMEGVLKK